LVCPLAFRLDLSLRPSLPASLRAFPSTFFFDPFSSTFLFDLSLRSFSLIFLFDHSSTFLYLKKKRKKKNLHIAFSKGKKDPPIKILKTVPSGLHDLGAPDLSSDVVNAISSNIPVVVVILILEHVAISKSFGRLNDYTIDPNQEFVAIGVANVFGSFFSAYPATGSFSRTAIKARAGVRTPIAGMPFLFLFLF
jgi:MFS superfamily sulfate permease-like transporter